MLPPDAAPVPRDKKRNAQATQQRILDAAELEFSRLGFSGARLREIADAAGVQPALIHHYFSDKQGLYRAVIERAIDQCSSASLRVLSTRADLEGLIEGLVDALIDFFVDHASFGGILHHETAASSSVLLDTLRERSAPVLSALRVFLADQARHGRVRGDIEPDRLLLLMLGVIAYPFTESALVAALLPRALPTSPTSLAEHKRAVRAVLSAALSPLPGK